MRGNTGRTTSLVEDAECPSQPISQTVNRRPGSAGSSGARPLHEIGVCPGPRTSLAPPQSSLLPREQARGGHIASSAFDGHARGSRTSRRGTDSWESRRDGQEQRGDAPGTCGTLETRRLASPPTRQNRDPRTFRAHPNRPLGCQDATKSRRAPPHDVHLRPERR